MTPSQFYIGQAVLLGLLSDQEADYLVTLETKYSWQMPSLTADLLTIDQALQLVRYEHTMHRMLKRAEVDTKWFRKYSALTNMTMKLIQCQLMVPAYMANGALVSESVLQIGPSHYTFQVLPASMTVTEVQAMNEAPDLTVLYPAVQYADTIPR